MSSVNHEQILKQLQIKLIDSIDILENDDSQKFIDSLENMIQTAKKMKLWGFYCFLQEILFYYHESNNLDKNLLELSIESLQEYTNSVCNGLYDIPVFHLVTLDLLKYNLLGKSKKHISLYTQSSFFLKSLEKNNISSFRCSFNEIQKMKIINSIEALEFFYDFDFTVKNYDFRKAIHSCMVLTGEFKGTQHEVLWDFCHVVFNFIENDDFDYADRLFFSYLFNEVIRNYSDVLEDMTFDSLEKNINKVISSLCYLLQKYNNRANIDNLTKIKLKSLIRMPKSNNLDSLIKFRDHIDFKEISVITLDFYSELDLTISSILENKKKKIDITDVLDILVKQQNSFIVIGYYQYWFEYSKALKEVNYLIQNDNFVDSKNINKLKDILFDLLELVTNLQKSENNMDNLPFCISTPTKNANIMTEKKIIDAEIVAQETYNKNKVFENSLVPHDINQIPANNIDTEKLKEMSDKFSKINNHILMLEKVVKQLSIVQDSVESAEIKNALNFISENAKEVHGNIKSEINSSNESFQKLYEEALDNEMANSVKSLLGSKSDFTSDFQSDSNKSFRKKDSRIKVLVFQINKEQVTNEAALYKLQNECQNHIDFKIISNKDLLEDSIEFFKPNLLIFDINKVTGILIEFFDVFNTINFSKKYPSIVLGDLFNHKESQIIIENGVSLYIQKPFESSKIIKVINILVKKHNTSNNIKFEKLEKSFV